MDDTILIEKTLRRNAHLSNKASSISFLEYAQEDEAEAEGSKPRKAPVIHSIQWQPPPPGWMKVNTDGCSRGQPGPSSCGGIFRNCRGFVHGCFALSLGSGFAYQAEWVGVMTAIAIAHSKGWKYLWIESDSTYAVSTPIATTEVLKLSDGSPPADPKFYRQALGSLQYLSLTRPDVSFAINKLSQFMHCPSTLHWCAVKRLLRYLVGTLDYGLLLRKNSPRTLHAFADADWAGDPNDRTSTSAYVVFLGANPISWSSKKQKTVARSSTEAEYRAIASTAAEVNWIMNLLQELKVPI
ncbi:UNVERIFIED_CONTAM: Retrovirus-related Pol polyprotein from transposon RE2 [Sesamum calycinum]|uniref:Retrovirus-related Pol polyprotein from transposon RE2 n=1 Tax=Sesamum calycinum TaxID=2727403 RepID=A0AAW2KQJ4_9LAMI